MMADSERKVNMPTAEWWERMTAEVRLERNLEKLRNADAIKKLDATQKAIETLAKDLGAS